MQSKCQTREEQINKFYLWMSYLNDVYLKKYYYYNMEK